MNVLNELGELKHHLDRFPSNGRHLGCDHVACMRRILPHTDKTFGRAPEAWLGHLQRLVPTSRGSDLLGMQLEPSLNHRRYRQSCLT